MGVANFGAAKIKSGPGLLFDSLENFTIHDSSPGYPLLILTGRRFCREGYFRRIIEWGGETISLLVKLLN